MVDHFSIRLALSRTYFIPLLCLQESRGALKVWLALEKLYLTEEATSQRVRNTNDSNSVKKTESVSYDMWEKRQLKAMGKLR